MKVKELIASLQKMPQEVDVFLMDGEDHPDFSKSGYAAEEELDGQKVVFIFGSNFTPEQ